MSDPSASLAAVLFMDKTLARRLERTEGAINASFIDARRALALAASEAAPPLAWRDFDGTYAMFDGVGSPMTQTFGLGLFQPTCDGELAAIEAFFRSFGSPTIHEVSPLAGVQAFGLLQERGYAPIELTNVLARSLDDSPLPTAALTPDLRVRTTTCDEAESWIVASIAGWGDTPDQAAHLRAIAEVAFANPAVVSFVVERGGQPIATGSLGIHEGVALLAGASTVPTERGRGAQKALLAARLAEAKRRGCDVALLCAEPGSTSQNNAERSGFRVAYTRTKWRLAS